MVLKNRKSFEYLDELLPFINNAFTEFYQALLKDPKMEDFFDSEEQVDDLIERQKANFESSLKLDIEVLKQSYIKLGEFHQTIGIPYVDFIKGAEILQESFLLGSHFSEDPKEVMQEILDYFKILRSYTAKGYLNKMIEEDVIDINHFQKVSSHYEEESLPKDLIFNKLNWLKGLLSAIRDDNLEQVEKMSRTANEYMISQAFPIDRRMYFEALESRIFINAQQLTFFLRRREYLEVLPLYNTLLTIYKLAFMMNNAITLEYAEKIIGDLRHDELSGLMRKGVFLEIVEKEIALFNRIDKPLSKDHFSVLLLDLDNFKSINDEHGHYVGDEVIQQLGEAILNSIRKSDYAFRIGGDEFAVLLRYSPLKGATRIAQTIQTAFCGDALTIQSGKKLMVTLSIGVLDCTEVPNMNYKRLLNAVDQRLYKAKQNGRDQIVWQD